MQDAALVEQLAYLARGSDFYREKLAAEGASLEGVRSTRDLAGLPFTEKSELRESLQQHPPLGSHVAARLEDVVQVQASSGTTGSPSYVGLTQSDRRVWCEMGARALYANGLRPGDRALHGFGMSKGFVGGLPVAQILSYMGVCEVPIGAEAGVERLLRVQADQRTNVLLGTPYYLIYLGEQAPDVVGSAARDLGVTTIATGGEPGGGIPSVRRRIEELWGATVRENLGGTDLGACYWGECEAGRGVHFLSPDLLVAELIDPDTGEQLTPAEGVEGELVYTSLRREASPLLRFRTRDRVVVTGTDCPCGRTGYMVRCIGRTDDMLIVRGINVFPSAVQDLVTGLRPRTTGELRIVADFDGHTTQRPLTILVEHGPSTNPAEVAQEVADRLRSALQFKPHVLAVAPGTLGVPGAGKVKLVERSSVEALPYVVAAAAGPST
ncbi:MAG: phenylacetate--CoA ligase family protein [Acidimicrobiia bacterium]